MNRLNSLKPYDLAVVGAGIVGLAHAYLAAKAGLKVCVIDRDASAQGASVRNFGFITVTGQERDGFYNLAMRTRDIWQEVCDAFNIPVIHRGLYMCARRPEAEAVLEAFLATEMGETCTLLSPKAVDLPLRPEIRAVLHSPHELRVESREALPALVRGLKDAFGVDFRFNTHVTEVETGRLFTSEGVINANHIVVCPGDNLNGLYASALKPYGISRCKLQMLRLKAPGYRLPGAVMSDLGLVRYLGYSALPEAAALKRVIEAEQAAHLRDGVHLIVVQSADGSLVVGDSHDYAATPSAFASEETDRLILEEYAHVLGTAPAVAERWIGTYATSAQQLYVIDQPDERVALVVVTCGAGASSAFGIAEQTLDKLGVLQHGVISH
jgi:D-hydroxyproline dehydrogenase subunit beta